MSGRVCSGAELTFTSVTVVSIIMDITKLRSELSAVGQEHLLQFWDQLEPQHQQALYDELSELDLEEVLEYFKRTVAEMNSAAGQHTAHPGSPHSGHITSPVYPATFHDTIVLNQPTTTSADILYDSINISQAYPTLTSSLGKCREQ